MRYEPDDDRPDPDAPKVVGPPCPDCGMITSYVAAAQGRYLCPNCGGEGVWCNLDMHRTNWPGMATSLPTCWHTWVVWTRGRRKVAKR